MAERTGYPERYLREWLGAQAASGYCHYDPDSGRFHLDEVQTACLADDSGPYFLAGGMLVATSLAKDEERIAEAFRTDTGVSWDDHHHDLFDGTVRFLRPGYVANLVLNWLPALAGVVAKLEAGTKVADIGCGYGASTIIMAEAYREALAPDGSWLLVEPNAGDRVEDNLNPVGRIFYSASTFICVPNARSQDGGWTLGAQAGEAQLREVGDPSRFQPLPSGHRNPVQPRL